VYNRFVAGFGRLLWEARCADLAISLAKPYLARTQEALGLPKRKVKDNADRQRRLECDVRVGGLAAGFGTGRSPPGVESGI